MRFALSISTQISCRCLVVGGSYIPPFTSKVGTLIWSCLNTPCIRCYFLLFIFTDKIWTKLIFLCWNLCQSDNWMLCFVILLVIFHYLCTWLQFFGSWLEPIPHNSYGGKIHLLRQWLEGLQIEDVTGTSSMFFCKSQISPKSPKQALFASVTQHSLGNWLWLVLMQILPKLCKRVGCTAHVIPFSQKCKNVSELQLDSLNWFSSRALFDASVLGLLHSAPHHIDFSTHWCKF